MYHPAASCGDRPAGTAPGGAGKGRTDSAAGRAGHNEKRRGEMKGLTKKQQNILDFIEEFQRREAMAPTVYAPLHSVYICTRQCWPAC